MTYKPLERRGHSPEKFDEDETRERGEVLETASLYSRMRRLRMAQIARVEAEILIMEAAPDAVPA